jgi:type II secretory pathway component PulF
MQSKLNFRYRCRDQRGKECSGTLTADSAPLAAAALKARGWTIHELAPDSRRRPGPVDAPAKPAPAERPPAVSRRQLDGFCAQVSALLDGGLPLLPALEALANGGEPAVCDLSRRLAARLEGGASLSQAIQSWPELFDAGFVASVRLGEKTGKLLFVLRRVADARQRQSERHDRLRAALAYPAFLALTCVAMLIFLITVLLPMLVKLIPSGTAPPWPTQLVIALSRLPLIPVSVAVVTLISASVFHLRTPEGRPWRDWLFYGPFPWSAHFLQVLWVDLTRALELLFASGVAASQVLPLLQPAAGPRLHDCLQRSHERFCQGSTLAEALSRERAVPRLLVQLLDVGESVGKMETFLTIFANLCEGELEGQREAFLTLLEPFLLVTLGGVVGFVVMASFLPAYQMVMVQ